jgi:hypothetical protein
MMTKSRLLLESAIVTRTNIVPFSGSIWWKVIYYQASEFWCLRQMSFNIPNNSSLDIGKRDEDIEQLQLWYFNSRPIKILRIWWRWHINLQSLTKMPSFRNQNIALVWWLTVDKYVLVLRSQKPIFESINF